MITVDAYPFLDKHHFHLFFMLSQRVTLRIREYGFSGSNVQPDSKKTKPGSSDQETSLSVAKNTEVVLVQSLRMEVRPLVVSQVPGCHLLRQISSQ